MRSGLWLSTWCLLSHIYMWWQYHHNVVGTQSKIGVGDSSRILAESALYVLAVWRLARSWEVNLSTRDISHGSHNFLGAGDGSAVRWGGGNNSEPPMVSLGEHPAWDFLSLPEMSSPWQAFQSLLVVLAAGSFFSSAVAGCGLAQAVFYWKLLHQEGEKQVLQLPTSVLFITEWTAVLYLIRKMLLQCSMYPL